MSELLFKDETFALRGACFEVYKEKGNGFLESVYQECLEIELGLREISFVPKPKLELEYKGRKLQSYFQPDLICFEKIVVELKAAIALCDEHRAQLHNYLKTGLYRLGLLVNFGAHPKVEIERIIR